MKMKKRWISTGVLICGFNFALAGDGSSSKSHGGVDVVLADGKVETTESFLESISTPIEKPGSQEPSICHLVDFEAGRSTGLEWRARLNGAIAAVYRKLPAAGETLLKVMSKPHFIFVNLEKGEKIRATYDSGSLVRTTEQNGAVRYQDQVYMDRNAWRAYWESQRQISHYTNPLTRVFHETLLEVYQQQNTHELGLMVVEMLRLGGYYPIKHGNLEFDRKTAKEVAAILYDGGRRLKAKKISIMTGSVYENVHENFSSQFSVRGRLVSESDLRKDKENFYKMKQKAEDMDKKYPKSLVDSGGNGYSIFSWKKDPREYVHAYHPEDLTSFEESLQDLSVMIYWSFSDSDSVRTYDFDFSAIAKWRERGANPPKLCQ